VLPDGFDRFLPLAGVLAGPMFLAGLILLRDDPPSESAVAETFAYWHAAAADRQRQAVYTLNQFHSYDWLGWNAAFAAMLLATGLGARRNGMLPAPLAWATIVIGASLLTPVGFFGFVLLPLWLIVVGIWLARRDAAAAPEVAVP
jgi:hypothetical protein